MAKSYRFLVMAVLVTGLCVVPLAYGGDQVGQTGTAPIDIRWCEEQGIELNENINVSQIDRDIPISTDREEEFLLIPESNSDYIGKYDPEDGSFLGYFVEAFAGFSTPICATVGPDTNIYVSDQVADAVFVFDIDGNYLSTYADNSDGLNNIRGIDFRGDHLFVTSGDDYVAEFDGPHSRLDDFINDGTDSFDILFLDDGRALLSDIQGTTDNVRLYDADGNFEMELFSVDFPEQIQVDALEPGAFLSQSFSDDIVHDFDLDGTIYETTGWDSGRGVFRLGNGNLLMTNSQGVFEVEPGSGAIIEQKSDGSARFIELVSIEGGTGIGDSQSDLPEAFRLIENYPNPFNASTTIKFELSNASDVQVDIYDILGKRIDTILDSYCPAGVQTITWNAGDFSSGVYFYRISAGHQSYSAQMVLLK